MYIIGVTGGIGAGKSEILSYLQSRYGAAVAVADIIGHLLMKPGELCYQPVIDLLGAAIVGTDNELNRAEIAAVVYNDKDRLEQLNKIIHPAVKERIKELIEQERLSGTKYFIIEAALLLEARYDLLCDEVWYIYADVEIRRERLKTGRSYSDGKIDRIMTSQLSETEFRKRCDVTFDNSKKLDDTIKQIELRMQRYENV